MRRYFLHHTTVPLERIVADLGAGIGYSHETLPPQMRPQPIVCDGSSSGSRYVASDLSGPSYGYGEAGTSKRQKQDHGALFSHRCREDIARAADAINPERLYASKLCSEECQVRDLLGPDFLSLLPQGSKTPC
jgi:hypothetical protein